MHRRHQYLNIPIEIVRTVVAISETGSLSKAGERLGLSQPAISSQVKRLQSLVGGELFVKTANGTTTTELGKLALHQARRILEANDQLLRLGGSAEGPQPIRLGLSSVFARPFLQNQTAESLTDIFIQTDHSVAIGKGLIDGYIDIACIFENMAIETEIEQLPILTWPVDDWMIRTLTRHGLSYKIVFNSPDFQTRLDATGAGIGLTALPASMVPASLVRAREYYLPELPPIRALLCARLGLETGRASTLLKQLTSTFFKPAAATAGA
jgi:DNA-binding transcriptional LysR family regulator